MRPDGCIDEVKLAIAYQYKPILHTGDEGTIMLFPHRQFTFRPVMLGHVNHKRDEARSPAISQRGRVDGREHLVPVGVAQGKGEGPCHRLVMHGQFRRQGGASFRGENAGDRASNKVNAG